MSRIYVALDLETTGLTDRDAILEIRVVKFCDDDVLETWSSFVAQDAPSCTKSLTSPASPSAMSRTQGDSFTGK